MCLFNVLLSRHAVVFSMPPGPGRNYHHTVNKLLITINSGITRSRSRT